MADWSRLPRDLLGKILEMLSLIDHLCFEVVCISWGIAVRDRHYRPKPQSPWLMHAAPSDHAITFLTLSDTKKLYNSGPLISQRLRGKVCIGSSPQGHLVTVDSTASAHLLNPLTGAQIPLPPVTTMPFPSVEAVFDSSGRVAEYLMEPLCSRSGPRYFQPEKLRDLYVSKAVVSSSSSTVAAIHGVTLRRLCYAKAGDTKWSPLASPGHFRDLVFHKGLLYTLSHEGLIESWDLDSPLPEPAAAVDATPADRLLRRDGNHFHKYLVEVGGELVQVWRERQFTVDEHPQRITRFRAFTLNEKRSRWVGSKRLPEHAVFVGHNSSFSLSIRDFPELKGNCIYFTDDLLDDTYRGPHQALDFGVYNLMDGSIERFYPPESLFDWPPPIWFTPSFL